MGDFVRDTCGKEPFEKAIEWIAKSNCRTPHILLSKYKKLRTVYDEAKKETEEIKNGLTAEQRKNHEELWKSF